MIEKSKKSLSMIGNTRALGKKHKYPPTQEHRNKISISKLGKKRLDIAGKKNYLWKGIKTGYRAKHSWLIRNFGKAIRCENIECNYYKPKRYEWANISGKHKRVKTDYIQLCPSCHRKWDNKTIKINNIKKND